MIVESYAYDANGNVITFTKRSGDVITYTYDALNRVIEKAVPGSLGQNVFYTYNLLNRLTAAAFGSPTGTTSDLYAYDVLGRMTSQTTAGVTMTSLYDASGDRTRLSWPDGFYATYVYDLMQRPIEVDGSGVGMLAQYTWDNTGNMNNVAMSNGASSHFGHDNAARIGGINLAFTNTPANLSWTFGYNSADQIVSRTADNDSYTYHPSVQSKTYVSNGLNQYSSVSGTTFSYDSNGNLTSDGSRSFTYDIDNHMLSGSAPTPLTVGFDPLGQRMWSQAAGATTPVYFVYDGLEIAEEYSAGLVLRRYVPSGLGETPLLWYEGTNESTPRWLHVDNQGSVMAYSDNSGFQQQAYGYDPFGIPPLLWGGAGHYSFTGQTTYGAVDAYNYKARTYDPILGRFLEADPIGQDGGVNTYAYAENDPVNGNDPSGMGEAIPDPKMRDGGGGGPAVSEITVTGSPPSTPPSAPAITNINDVPHDFSPGASPSGFDGAGSQAAPQCVQPPAGAHHGGACPKNTKLTCIASLPMQPNDFRTAAPIDPNTGKPDPNDPRAYGNSLNPAYNFSGEYDSKGQKWNVYSCLTPRRIECSFVAPSGTDVPLGTTFSESPRGPMPTDFDSFKVDPKNPGNLSPGFLKALKSGTQCVPQGHH